MALPRPPACWPRDYTFGTVRGGGVVAWDNNETRGTLGIRGTRSAHRNTTRELLEDLGRFCDVFRSRIGDLGAFVRSQGDAHFDVLASDERPDVTGTIRAEDFPEVHGLLERFYRVILVDTGNNMRAENWLAAAEAADLLVVTSTVREDTGYSGLWMLDALQDAGHQNLKYKTLTVLADPSRPGRRRARRRPRRGLRAAHPRGLPRALRPGPGRRLRRALRPAVAAHPAPVADGVRGDGRGVSERPGAVCRSVRPLDLASGRVAWLDARSARGRSALITRVLAELFGVGDRPAPPVNSVALVVQRPSASARPSGAVRSVGGVGLGLARRASVRADGLQRVVRASRRPSPTAKLDPGVAATESGSSRVSP